MLVIGAAVFGVGGATFSVAQAVGKANPRTAYRLAPYDGRVTAAYAASLADAKAAGAERRHFGILARRALKQDATAVAAVSTLALEAELRGDSATARRLLSYAQALTRRDLGTQLWAIEDAVARNDVPEALKWYDISLRTKRSAPDTLFPILAAASEDPVIRTQLIARLSRKPEWSESFLNYVGGRDGRPDAAAALFIGLQRAGVRPPESARADVINRLIAKRSFELAWSYYASARPGADRRRSRDPRFVAAVRYPSSLDWVASNDDGVTTSIQEGSFEFSTSATVGGPLLQQTQLLAPGEYRLLGRSKELNQGERYLPYWVLICVGGPELGRVSLPNSIQADGSFSGTFTVPAGCPAQVLALVGRPSDAVGGLTGRITQAELVPAG